MVEELEEVKVVEEVEVVEGLRRAASSTTPTFVLTEGANVEGAAGAVGAVGAGGGNRVAQRKV